METPKRKSANDSGRKHQIVKKLNGRVMFDSEKERARHKAQSKRLLE